MKIALVCTSLGRVLRGFESFTESLFKALRQAVPSLEVTLFQGGGRPSGQRVVIPHFPRGNTDAIALQQRSFALFLYPWIRRGRYEIVYYNELVMGSALFHLRRYLGGNFTLLYCNGAPSPPAHYDHRCDFAQMLTEPMYQEAISFGLAPERLFLIPYGVDGTRFSPENQASRSQIRREMGIPENARVILTVAALKCEHKRVDYVIKELAALAEPVWLVAAGQRTKETPYLERKADELLPGRWCFVSWPHNRIPQLYGAADLLILPSLSEGFGLVSVEAMLSGMPILVHDTPQNRWIVNHATAGLMDMSQEGNLSRRLRDWMTNGLPVHSPEETARRFSWENLIPQYIRMYQKVARSKVPI